MHIKHIKNVKGIKELTLASLLNKVSDFFL